MSKNDFEMKIKDACQTAFKNVRRKYPNMLSSDLQTIAIFVKELEECLKPNEFDAIYINNGYDNREQYLRCMADDYGVPINIVLTLADTLGPNEDFDGLISSLQDYEDMCDFSEE